MDFAKSLLTKGKCTLSGLLEVLQTLKISVEAHELQFANQIHFEAVCLTEQIQLADASFFNWEFADPYLLVQRALQESPSLRGAYARAAAANPGPWSLVIGFDEFVPGSKLKLDNRKKLMNVGFNFIELGSDVLSSDMSWCIPV